MSLEDEIAAIKRLIERGEARAGHLESHHGKASIVIDKHDLNAMRAIKARLEGMAAPPPQMAPPNYIHIWTEGMAAPGDAAVGKDSFHTEREADWFAFLCRGYVQRSDARQKESGLQYTEAETHDLAKECARHEAEFVTDAPGDATERARKIAAEIDVEHDGTAQDACKVCQRVIPFIAAALTAAEDGATQRERERCALAARGGGVPAHVDCGHEVGYMDGRLDAEAAIRALPSATAATRSATEDGARKAALDDAVQIALAYRDEADAGQHPDKGDPHHSLGQGYAANIIAKRIRALIAVLRRLAKEYGEPNGLPHAD